MENLWNSAPEVTSHHIPLSSTLPKLTFPLQNQMVCWFYPPQEFLGGRIAIVPLFNALIKMESARFGFFKIPSWPSCFDCSEFWKEICAAGVKALGKIPKSNLQHSHLSLDFKHSSRLKIFSKLAVNKAHSLFPRHVFLRFHCSKYYEQYLHSLLLHHSKIQTPSKKKDLEVSLNVLSG